MRKRRLIWRLFPTYLLITILSLMAVSWYTVRYVDDFYYRQKAEDLEARALIFREQIQDRFLSLEREEVDRRSKEAGGNSNTRFTVILTSGVVVGDTEEDPARMENHAGRPEIQTAMEGKTGQSVRYSATLAQRMMYVAVPIYGEEGIVAVARASVPVTSIDLVLGIIKNRIALWGLLIALLAAAISLFVSRRISLPLEEMKKGSEKFARGELSTRLAVPDTMEMGGLAEAMNLMASRLDERIRTVVQQRNELEAVLSSMVEGVMAFNTEERLISINKAAARWLEIEPEKAEGRIIQEVVRNIELQNFVSTTLATEEPGEIEIILRGEEERFLQVHGTILRAAEGSVFGVLIVLNDVTSLRRLERVRRDFVANVSHELKTPITSITGAVETLVNGAMEDKEDARRFLNIIGKQSDRLGLLVDDLLTLARVEQEAERSGIEMDQADINSLIKDAMEASRDAAVAKDISLELESQEGLLVNLNRSLMTQAVFNLIDNALKYSDPGKSVRISASREDGRVVIRISDQGWGIEEKHQTRLFERFYRVDKGRSRELGGTGLGLAIVKHIVQAHGGGVSVESKPGKGSTFTIHLPSATEQE
jgi:two-component system phosphate regulon sensor histidine kinase PhoR